MREGGQWYVGIGYRGTCCVRRGGMLRETGETAGMWEEVKGTWNVERSRRYEVRELPGM